MWAAYLNVGYLDVFAFYNIGKLMAKDKEEEAGMTYAHVCSRMLTYAHVYSRMLMAKDKQEEAGMTYVDVC